VSRGGYPWWLPAAGAAGSATLHLLGRSWRIDPQDDPDYLAAEARGERFVYCFWHARLLPLAFTHRGEGIAVLVSRHRDGEVITRIIEGLGFVTGRGSSTRGGEAGLREMLLWAERGRHLAVTPDGPRGPAEVLKEGVVYLAARLERRVVPIATASAEAWVGRSWDGFRVPRPFARVAIAHGAPLTMPAAADTAALASARTEVERALRDLTARTRARVAEVR
jgi:hypothetical protein